MRYTKHFVAEEWTIWDSERVTYLVSCRANQDLPLSPGPWSQSPHCREERTTVVGWRGFGAPWWSQVLMGMLVQLP